MSLKYPINVYGLRRKVFNHTVAKTYLTLQEIAQLKTYDEGYQRKRDKEHEDKIIEYLQNSSNRYLPDIVIAIRHKDMDFSEISFLNNRDFYIRRIKAYGILRINFWTERALNNIKVIDGNHRISAVKRLLQENPESELADFEIGVTFIFTKDEQEDFENEMALFYYLNSKSKPLLPNDYLSDAVNELEADKAKEIDWWLYLFKKSYDGLSDIFSDRLEANKLNEAIASSCDYFAKQIEKDDFETLPNFIGIVRDIVSRNLIDDLLDIFINNEKLSDLLNILYFIEEQYQDIDKTLKEFRYFYDWLSNYAKLDQFGDFKNLYKTYKETYISQDYKIFVAMEFAGNDNVYSAMSGCIDNVARDMELPLECIRIDKVEKGNTYQIMDEILKQIQHNRLLIADITNKNPNVYLEVGYAMGLAKSMGIDNQIMLFVEDEGSDTDVGFDLQSYQQNRYRDTEDLRTKLEFQLKVYYKKLIS